MRRLKTTKGWKVHEDEREDGTPNPNSSWHWHYSSWHSSSNVDSSPELKTAALASPLSADTTSSAAALTISNPVIVNAFDTAAFGNPDPAGLGFIPGAAPGTGAFLVADSEVDEAPFFATNNLFYYSLSGNFDHSTSLKSFTIEPTGLAYDSFNGHLFISDDDKNAVFEVDAANPGVKLNSFSVSPFAPDAEDIAFDPVTNHLLILEGDTGNVNPRKIFERTPSGVAVQTIALTNLVPPDLEAIAYDPVNQVFYVTGGASQRIYVVSRDGQTLLNTITVLEGLTNTLSDTGAHPKGLLLAPSSDPNDDPSSMSLYVADYGRDQVMDGRIYEIQLNGPAPQPALFTTGNNVVDFNQLAAGSYLAGSQYNALAGDDTVILPTDTAAAASAGYNPVQSAFRGGDGNDTITGGSLNDTIYGDAGTDTLKGGAGNDRLLGGNNNDTLSGGLGNDFLDGGSNTDTADYSTAAAAVTVNLALGTATGEGNDTLLNIENVTGSGFDDTITGSTLANILTGGDGNDTLTGGSANDTLTGGSGLDKLSGDVGHDTLKWDSADTFDGGVGFDTLDANLASSDTIDLRGSGFATLERILTGSGNDTVTLSLDKILSDTADDQFVADLGSGTDTLKIDVSGGWTATTPNSKLGPTGVAAGISISGLTANTFTNGSTTVTVFTNAEVVQQVSSGLSPLFTTGNDTVDFNQVVAGSYLAGSQYDALAGNDTVTLAVDTAAASAAGYSVGQLFSGGDGNDIITGGTLDDTVNGGNDNDTLAGGLGNDALDGGAGTDTVDYTAAATAVVVDLALGTATGQGNDTLLNIENVTGSGSDDSITGNTGANILLGAGGNDTLSGGDGNDTLTGGAGIDKLSGDVGHDTLKWDSADTFDGGVGFDTLDADLSSADVIDLRGAAFANLERILTGNGNDNVTVGLSKILSDTADRQFVADLGGNTDTLTIDVTGGWSVTTPNSTLGQTGVAAGISVAGMTAYTFTDGTNTVTVFSNAETVQQIPSGPPLFTTGGDTVNFAQVVAGAYLAGSQYDALAGNDTVTLPIDAAAAAAAGFNPAQTFNGGAGNDLIIGGTLNDLISGGNDNDIIQGGTGDDTLTGGGNSDKLDGGDGNDSLNGGNSADTLVGGLGDDLLDGGGSNDTADYTAAATSVTANLSLGTATGQGNDTLLNIENVTGSALDDTITGNTLANVLIGGGGNDVIHGGDGNDTLTGGAGIDQVFGDAGHDMLKWEAADFIDGGIGFDTLDANLSSADTIDLRSAGFANLERIQTGSGRDTVTLSLADVLSDTADHQFVADLGSSSPDTLNIDLAGGWVATTSDPTLGSTGAAAGISVAGMTAYTFTNGVDTATVFSNAEVVNAQILS